MKALITGGTDGIGRATARALLEEGWEVIITGRNPTRCEDTVRALQAAVPNAKVSALTGDLGLMASTARLAKDYLAVHQQLDLLVLNANSITQDHTLTPEGFEANLAVGFLSRALLAWELQDVLERTPGAQVLSVVGLNLERLDFEDPSAKGTFSSMKALGRWQWAIQLFAREWNRRTKVPMNTFMPGLVKTKILANEPQPMRLFVNIAKYVVGLPVERSGGEVVSAVKQVTKAGHHDGYFSRTRFKGPRKLSEQPDDGARLWALATRLLQPWRPNA